MKKQIAAIVIALIGSQVLATTQCLTIPSENKDLIYEAVATRRGWTEQIQKENPDGSLAYQDNGSPLLVKNPLDSATVTRQAVIQFITDEVKAYQVQKAEAAAKQQVENSLSGINIQ